MAYTLNQAMSIRIQGLMEQQGITIEEVADRANISVEIIRKLINL